MGTFTNILQTIFTSTGSNEVLADTERLGRAQTRLGNSSAGTGRQFAAQASGLGGLVAAYAGAAATSFALTAAFDALAKSARAVQTIQGVDTLAAGIAQSGSQILKSVSEITKGQLTLTATAEQVNLALSAGFSGNQVEELASVSLKASRALGRDLTDAMTRVVRGSAKMETELLDELGIYTKIEPATRAYAAALGKNVSALSEFERRQAFVNAVIAEGQRKFSSINTTVPTSAEQIEALGAKLSNMATQLGSILADMLAPLATGVVDNAAAAFGAFGIVLSLIAGKGVQLFTASVKALEHTLLNSLRTNENTWRARLKITDAVIAATNANRDLAQSVLRLNTAEKASLANIQQTASSRSLTRAELKDSSKLLQNNLALLKTERQAIKDSSAAQRDAYRATLQAKSQAAARVEIAKALPQGGGFGTPLFIARTTAINAAKTALRKATEAELQLKPAIDATRASLTANMAAIVANTNAINANKAAVMGWRALLAGAATSVITPFIKGLSNLGNTFGFVVGKASSLFFLVSMFQLVGSAIANAIGKGEEFNAFFSSLGSTITSLVSDAKGKATKNIILGISAGALADLEKVDKKLRDTEKFSFKQTSFFGVDIKIEKTKEELVSEVSNMLVDAGDTGSKSFWSSFTSTSAAVVGVAGAAIGGPLGAAIGTAVGAAIDAAFFSTDTAEALATKYGKDINDKFGSQIAQLPQDVQAVAIRALAQIQDKYGDKALFDPAARSAKELQESLVFASVEALRTVEAIQQVSSATAQSAAEVQKNFDFIPAQDGIDGIATSLSYVSEAITSIGNQEIRFLFVDDMNEQLKGVLNTAVLTGKSLKEALNIDSISIPSLLGANTTYTGTELDRLMQDFSAKISEGLSAGNTLDDIVLDLKTNGSDADKALIALMGDSSTLGGVVTTLSESYYKLSGAINAVQNTSLQASQVLKTTNDEYTRGVLTLEKFSQNTSNVKDALLGATRQLPSIAEALQKAEEAFTQVQKTGTPEQKKAAEATLNAERLRYSVLEDSIRANQSILKEMLLQEDSMKQQIELTAFLKEQGKGVLSDIEFNFQLATAGAKDAKAASVDYFKTLIANNKAASIEAANYQAKIREYLKSNPDIADNLSVAETAAIMGASLQNINQTSEALKNVDPYVRTFIDDQIQIIGLVEQASQDALGVVDMSADAMKKIGQQAAIEIISLAEKFKQEVTSQIEEITTSLADLQVQDNIAKIQFEIDMLDVQAKGQQAAFQFEKAFKENQIQLIELKVDNKKLEPTQGAEQINQLKTEIQAIQEAAIAAERAAIQERFYKENELRIADYNATYAKIKAEGEQLKAKFQAEYKLLSDVASVYSSISTQMSTAITNGGNAAGQAIVNAANTAAQTLGSALGPIGKLLGLGTKAAAGVFTPVQAPTQAASMISTPAGMIETDPVKLALKDAENSMITFGKVVDKATKEKLDMATQAYVREQQLAEANYAAMKADIARRTDLSAQERAIMNEENEKRLKEAKEAGGGGDAKLSEIDKKLQTLFDSIKGHIESALMGLNDLIFYGEGNFGDIMGNLFKSIQQDFFKQTVADPLSNMLTKTIFGSLGVSVTKGEKGLTFNASDNSLLVRVVNAAEIGLGGGGVLGSTDPNDPATTGIMGWMQNLLGKGGPLANMFTGLFGEDGILSGIINGFGSFLGSIFKAIFGGIFGGGFGGGKVTGGIMHMAQGGVAGSSALRRDRIPALLEPGEFVVRKPVARMVGTPALNALNATGRMPNGGAPVINMINEGSPKDVQQAKPRFDGEKYVIDIIMRDLNNNGPIRKSLRGGAI